MGVKSGVMDFLCQSQLMLCLIELWLSWGCCVIISNCGEMMLLIDFNDKVLEFQEICATLCHVVFSMSDLLINLCFT